LFAGPQCRLFGRKFLFLVWDEDFVNFLGDHCHFLNLSVHFFTGELVVF
jgi:hypothetical protein